MPVLDTPVTFVIEDAFSGTVMKGIPVYDNEGRRVGQLSARIHEVTTYGLHHYLAVEDVRSKKID